MDDRIESQIAFDFGRLEGCGRGYCGSGEEVTLRVTHNKKEIFSKLIESCLESIELDKGDNLKILEAVRWEPHPIQIHWLSRGKKGPGKGQLDLSGDKPQYTDL